MRLEEYGIVYYRCSLGDPPPARYKRYDYRRHHIITENKAEGDTGLVWCSSPDDFITLCEKWTTKHWKFCPVGRIGPEISATRNKPERTHTMITIVNKEKKNEKTVGVGWMKNGTTFTGTIKFKRTNGEEAKATGLFLLTSDKAEMGEWDWVVVILKSNLSSVTRYIRGQVFTIEVENCKIVDLNIEVVERD